MDINGFTDSSFSVTDSGASLTLESTSGTLGAQVIISSAGTGTGSGTSAIDIDASAGGIELDAAGQIRIDSAGTADSAVRIAATGTGGGLELVASQGGNVSITSGTSDP